MIVADGRRLVVRPALIRAGVAGVAAAGLVAACTTVPDNGPVHAGARAVAGGANTNVHVAAQPPVDGESPSDIVGGFRFASADYDGGYAVAKSYLTDPSWEPDQRVKVVDETGELRLVTQTGDQTVSVELVDNELGEIAPDGTYQPVPSTNKVSYTYQLVKDPKAKGQWRIKNPPQELVLTVNQVRNYYQTGYVYYLSPGGQMLVPIRVFLPVAASDRATSLVNTLLSPAPNWLKPAVTTAFPPTTAQPVVTTSGGIVTVDLPHEVATLKQTQRDEVAAQLAYTLADVAPVGVRILSGGQPLINSQQAALHTPKVWEGFDPDALRTDSFLFVGQDHKTRDSSGTVLAGDLGSTATAPVLSVAVAPRPAGTDGDLIAAVVQVPGAEELYAGPIHTPKGVSFAGSFTSPSWDSLGNLWVVKRGGGAGPQQVQVAPLAGSFLPVADPELANSSIKELKVSRDGTRVAVIVQSTTGSQALIGRVTKTDGGLSIDKFYPLFPSLTTVTDVAWTSTSSLDLLVSSPGTSSALWSVDVDGWTQVQRPVLPQTVSIAAAPDKSLVVGTTDKQIEVYSGDAWQFVGQGTAPSYPG